MSIEGRAQLPGARRVVVKVGSSSISGENAGKIQLIVEALADAHARGTEVVLVSSGAIATGMPYLALDERPVDLATQQAAAAVGQNVLIYRYQDALRPFAIVAGQVLLTAGDLENATHRSNARRAMESTGIEEYFDILVAPDTFPAHKPDPAPVLHGCEIFGVSPDECIYIGDSPYDLQAGRGAGCVTVAALWGMFAREELLAEHPDYAITTLSELVPIAAGK